MSWMCCSARPGRRTFQLASAARRRRHGVMHHDPAQCSSCRASWNRVGDRRKHSSVRHRRFFQRRDFLSALDSSHLHGICYIHRRHVSYTSSNETRQAALSLAIHHADRLFRAEAPPVTSRQPLRSAVAFLALAAHNAEEALFAQKWALANGELLKQYTGRDLAETWAGSGFRLSLVGLTLLLLALAVAAARAPKRGAAVYLLLGVLAVFAANALFPHVAGALMLQGYVPGVATAILFVLPVAAWVFVATLREDYATRRGSFTAATVGMAFYAAMVGLALSP